MRDNIRFCIHPMVIPNCLIFIEVKLRYLQVVQTATSQRKRKNIYRRQQTKAPRGAVAPREKLRNEGDNGEKAPLLAKQPPKKNTEKNFFSKAVQCSSCTCTEHGTPQNPKNRRFLGLLRKRGGGQPSPQTPKIGDFWGFVGGEAALYDFWGSMVMESRIKGGKMKPRGPTGR